MRLKTAAVVVFAWWLAGIASAYGQQAFRAEFDVNKPIHLEGKITKLEWANPHVAVDIDVAGVNSGSASWRVELTSPSNLFREGITKNAIRVGDAVAVDGFVAISGMKRVGSSSIVLKDVGIEVAIMPEAWHHSYAEQYDVTKPARMTGTFVSIDWVNPRPALYFRVTTPTGGTELWQAELPALSSLNRQGWTKTTLTPGDEIQVSGSFARDGSRNLFANNVTLIATGGTALAPARTLLGGAPVR